MLRASWTSSDPESGIAEYRYLIRSALSITPIMDWTSVGAATSVTRDDLALAQGEIYYFMVWAKNGAGLWSQIGMSRNLYADLTPPATPTSPPVEGLRVADADYDDNGFYWIYWSPTTDPDSWIDVYELQEQAGPDAPWTTMLIANTWETGVAGRLHGILYRYRVRARNRAGLWSDWSPPSDGIMVDMTRPQPATVSDDGVTTTSTATLHATWTPARDPESGIAEYQYQIWEAQPQSSRVLVDWTSVGLSTEFTRTNLPLKIGRTYQVFIRAINGAGLSWAASSDGITVVADTVPPVVKITYPTNGMLLGAAK